MYITFKYVLITFVCSHCTSFRADRHGPKGAYTNHFHNNSGLSKKLPMDYAKQAKNQHKPATIYKVSE